MVMPSSSDDPNADPNADPNVAAVGDQQNLGAVIPKEAFLAAIQTETGFQDAVAPTFGSGSGVDGEPVTGDGIAKIITFGAADTDFTVEHNLGFIPAYYEVMGKDRAADIYDGTVAATTTTLTLKSAVANAVVRLRIVGRPQ